jgi:predicted phage gp36 major capsid-like protein
MYSNSGSQQTTDRIARLRSEQQRLLTEEREERDREKKAIIRIQHDAERNYDRIRSKHKDLDREINLLEGEQRRAQADLSKRQPGPPRR